MMINKILGIDLGISFVGFSLIDIKLHKIIKSGVHIFSPNEDPKTGFSLSLPLRIKRRIRNNISRKGKRNRKLKKFLVESGFDNINLLSKPFKLYPSVWDLRNDALKRLLSDLELARCLLHISKRRGFKSTRKISQDDEQEIGKMLQGIKDLDKNIKESKAITVGQYISSLEKKKNNSGEYYLTPRRELLLDEVKIILEKQYHLGNKKLSPSVQEQIYNIIFYQNPLQSVMEKVGFCSIYPTEKRAAKHSFSAELFVFYSQLNNIKIKNPYGDNWKITIEMRDLLLKKSLATEKITFFTIRKLWDIPDDYLFNLVNYKNVSVEDINKEEKKKEFFCFKGYHIIKKALEKEQKETWNNIENEKSKLDTILTIISFEFDSTYIINKLNTELKLPIEVCEILSKTNKLSKTINLSLKAVNQLIPFLRVGDRYNDACKSLDIDKIKDKKKKSNRLPEFEKTNNPVVDRACSQARKVINSIIQRYGLPDAIHLELGTDLGKSRKERDKIHREQKKNFETNQSILIEATEFYGYEPSTTEKIKYKLWKEQKGLCIYSGKYIEPDILKDHNYTKINHIIPLSRSYDDSFSNKVLCFTSQHQKKGGQTPFEYIGDNQDLWNIVESISNSLPYSKRRRLLLKDFEQIENDYKSRNLNDMRFASRHLKEHIQNNLDVRKIFSINGRVTSFIRNSWQIQKIIKNNFGDKVVDSAVIACATEDMIQKITRWNKYDAQISSLKPIPPIPWDSFLKDLEEEKSQIFISRKPRRKITGAAHHETYKSLRNNDNTQYSVKRIPISNVNLQNLKNMVDLERNQNLFNILSERLEKYDNDPSKAFATDIYMKTNDGSQGPLIKGIRIYDSSKSGVKVCKGIANNGDMIRVDVFSKINKNNGKKEFYLCPIYVAHTVSKTLPNNLCTSHTEEKDWPLIDENYLFCFSIFKNDLIKIGKKNGMEIMGYFNCMDRSNASISIMIHDNSELIKSIGVKNLTTFEKFNVNYFGEKFKVNKERRLELAYNNNTKRVKNSSKKQTNDNSSERKR